LPSIPSIIRHREGGSQGGRDVFEDGTTFGDAQVVTDIIEAGKIYFEAGAIVSTLPISRNISGDAYFNRDPTEG
jgi:hypothetical protein